MEDRLSQSLLLLLGTVCLVFFSFAWSLYGQETTVRLFNQPTYSAFDANANVIYVIDRGDNSLSVLDAEILKVLHKIPVGEAPSGLEYNPTTKKVYVANRSGATVSMIDMTDIRNRAPVPKIIPVGRGPTTIRIDPALNLIYTVARDENLIFVIDGAKDEVKEIAPLPPGIHHVEIDFRINPVTHKVYFTAGHNDAVVVFDPQNMQARFVPLGSGGHPHMLRIDSTLNKIFVVNFRKDTVSVIDGFEDELVEIVKVGKNPRTLTLIESNHKIYVGHEGENTIYVIDGKTNEVVAQIPISGTGYVTGMQRDEVLQKVVATQWLEDKAYIIDGKTDQIIAVLDTGVTPIIPGIFEKFHRSYILNFRSGTITVVNLQNNKVIDGSGEDAQQKGRGEWLSNPFDFAQIDDKLYISNEDGFVTVFDIAREKVLKKIPTGKLSRRIVAHPDTRMVYVSNIGSGTISVIDAESDEVTNTVVIKKGEVSVALNESTNVLYVGMPYQGTLLAIDGVSGAILSEIAIRGAPSRLILHQKKNLVFTFDKVGGVISVVDGKSHKLIGSVPIGYHHNGRMALDEESDKLYISGGTQERQAKLTVIDIKNFVIADTIPLVGDPWAIAWNSKSGTLFYTSHNDRFLHEVNPVAKTDIEVEDLAQESGGVRYDPISRAIYATSDSAALILARNGEFKTMTFHGRGDYNYFYLAGDAGKIFMSYQFENVVQLLDFFKERVSLLKGDGSVEIISGPAGLIERVSKPMELFTGKKLFLVFSLLVFFIVIAGIFILLKKRG